MRIDDTICQFLQNYFDKIFVITIQRATDRQQYIKTQLAGLDFNFFYGVDKHDLSLETGTVKNIYDDKKAKQYNRYGRGMILRHIACALSHRKLYEHIFEKGYKKVLVFEDDAVSLLQNLPQLPAAINELPSNWELVYLGYSKNNEPTLSLKGKQLFYRILSRLRLLKWSSLMVNNLLPKPYSGHLYQAGFHDFTHAYLISGSACKKLINAQNPVAFNSDSVLSYLIMNGELNAFITKPQFFTQHMYVDPSKLSLITH